MELVNVDFAPCTKRSKRLTSEKSKRSFNSIVNFTKSNPLTKALMATLLFMKFLKNIYVQEDIVPFSI